MNPFVMKITPDAGDVDTFGRAKPSTLLYFCQEAAGRHCKLLGLDWESLAKKDLFWALIRTRMEISRMPGAGESVFLKTWPMPTTHTAFPRACEGRDEEGMLLFRCTSLWVLMNQSTRAMVLPGKSGIVLDGITLGCEADAPGSLGPIAGKICLPRQVTEADLDRNGHMNNTRYMDWVWEHLQDNHSVKATPTGFTACYISEALLGQALKLESCQNGDGSLSVEIKRPREETPQKPERIFAAKLEF